MKVGLAVTGCIALAVVILGLKKRNTILTTAGQCLGAVVLVLTFSMLTGS